MKENAKQVDLGDKGGWVEVELPKDENVIELEVGEEFIGIYAGVKPNPTFKNDVIHVFETENGNVRMMYGKTNLDRWLKVIDFGNRVKIKRLEDKKIGQPKPLQIFKVWVWEDV
jgi:hypothetical protein